MIDLGAPGSNAKPNLHETRGQIGKFITLYHRWTPLTELASTTLSNFQTRMEAIDFSSLTPTFQDNIELCRKLEDRYLWIDSLCIIRDSEEDWKMESRNMMAIYESAWLNITAAGSDAPDGRLFMKRTPSLNRPCQLPSGLSVLFVIDSSRAEATAYSYIDTLCFGRKTIKGFSTDAGSVCKNVYTRPERSSLEKKS